MLMIDYLSWVAMGLVMVQFSLFSADRRMLGWWTGIAAAIAWAIYATVTEQWAVLGLQVFLFSVAVYTLKKLGWWIKTSGLSRRDVVESKNQKTTAFENAHEGDDHDPIIGEIYDHL